MKIERGPLAKVARRYFAASAAFSALMSLSAVEANAGFFDFLFPQQPQIAVPLYRAPAQPTFHKKKIARKPKIIASKPHTPARVVSSFMEDESLQNGDAVMTNEGLRVFTGSSGLPHSTGDFARISDIKRMPNRQREALAAIESEGLRAHLVTGRSVSDSGLSSGEMIVDPRGAKIRYVGP